MANEADPTCTEVGLGGVLCPVPGAKPIHRDHATQNMVPPRLWDPREAQTPLHQL